MANEYLTFKNWSILSAALPVIFGLGFVFIPEDVIDMYDVTLTHEGYNVTRLLGAAFILVALVVWFAKDLEPSDLRQNLSISYIIGNGLGAILSLISIFDEDTDANGLLWLNAFLYALIAVGFAYLTFFETEGTASAATT